MFTIVGNSVKKSIGPRIRSSAQERSKTATQMLIKKQLQTLQQRLSLHLKTISMGLTSLVNLLILDLEIFHKFSRQLLKMTEKYTPLSKFKRLKSRE